MGRSTPRRPCPQGVPVVEAPHCGRVGLLSGPLATSYDALLVPAARLWYVMMLLGTSYAHLHHDCFQPNDPFLGCKERTYVDLGRSGPVVIYSFGLFSVRSVSSASRVVLEKDSVASSFEYPHVQVSMYPSQVARHVIVCLRSSLTPATMIFAGPPPLMSA